jgi:hypothetical protein
VKVYLQKSKLLQNYEKQKILSEPPNRQRIECKNCLTRNELFEKFNTDKNCNSNKIEGNFNNNNNNNNDSCKVFEKVKLNDVKYWYYGWNEKSGLDSFDVPLYSSFSSNHQFNPSLKKYEKHNENIKMNKKVLNNENKIRQNYRKKKKLKTKSLSNKTKKRTQSFSLPKKNESNNSLIFNLKRK